MHPPIPTQPGSPEPPLHPHEARATPRTVDREHAHEVGPFVSAAHGRHCACHECTCSGCLRCRIFGKPHTAAGVTA